LAGWQAQGYDLGLQAAWDGARDDLREQARDACRQAIASHHVRDLRVAADFNNETWRYVLLPVYLAAYRYGGHAYQVMINGQTGTCTGQKPVDWARVWVVVALLLAPGLALSLLGLPLLVAGGLGTVFLGLGGALFVIGLVISVAILVQATRAGEA
jgi:hypothetical protein